MIDKGSYFKWRWNSPDSASYALKTIDVSSKDFKPINTRWSNYTKGTVDQKIALNFMPNALTSDTDTTLHQYQG